MAKATTVAARIKDRFEGARLQLVDLEKKIGGLPKGAKKTFGEVEKRIEEVPEQLKGAFDSVVLRLREVLDFASREDLNELSEKVDDLAKKVDKLIRGDKIRNAAEKKPSKKA
jgi:hypothetical protein